MDGGIDAVPQQGLLDLLDEQSLASGLRQGAVLDGIARGLDGHDLDGTGRREGRNGGRQRIAHEAGLGEGQLAAARAEPEKRKGHGAALA